MPLVHTSSYPPPFGLSNGHLQTIYPTLFRRQPSVVYTRERLETPDGDFLDLDWLANGDSKKLVILTHGLESSSRSKYICGMADIFQDQGWHALAWNLRGCSGEANRLLTSYHSGSTNDLATVIEHVQKSRNYDTLALVGFSLGGNITLKYVGDLGADIDPTIKSAVAFSVATDLESSARRLERFENRIYMRRFLNTLTDKVRHKMNQFPGEIAERKLEAMRTFREFDGHYTAPLNGFRDASDYWSQSSCGSVLSRISIPTLLVNALNDPFLADECYPVELARWHPHLHLETPQSGGHMGFVTFDPDNKYWSERRCAEFVQCYV
jgi:predicted alpha/beta-fold hydrolase